MMGRRNRPAANQGAPISVSVRNGSVISLQQNQPETVWRYRSGGKTGIGGVSLYVEDIISPDGSKVELEVWKNGSVAGSKDLGKGTVSVPGMLALGDGDLLEVKLVARGGMQGITRVFDMWIMYRSIGG